MEKETSLADARWNRFIDGILGKGALCEDAPKHMAKRWLGFKFAPAEKRAIKEFHDFLKVKGLKPSSRAQYLYFLRDMAEFTKKKDFKEISKADLISYFAAMRDRVGAFGMNTKKLFARVFFKWLYKTEDYPSIVKGEEFKLERTNKIIREEELPSAEDNRKMLEACDSIRDKVIFALFEEKGMRRTELAGIRIMDVSFKFAEDKNNKKFSYAVVCVSGKTGTRELTCVRSANLLRELINSHPEKDKPDSYVFFYREHGDIKPLTSEGVYRVIKRMAERANVKKRIYCHLYRYGAATRDTNYLNPEELKAEYGWARSSSMPAKYCSVRKEEMRNKIFAHNGIKIGENGNNNESAICSRCGMANNPGVLYCNFCDSPMSAEVVMKQQKEEEQRIFTLIKRFFFSDEYEKVRGYAGAKQFKSATP